MTKRKRKTLGSSPQEHRFQMASMVRETYHRIGVTLEATSCPAAIMNLVTAAEYHGQTSAEAGARSVSAGGMKKDLAQFDHLSSRMLEARDHAVRVCQRKRKGS